ncbi:MAG: penicillin-binding protein 2 [Dongiaceae bacterium]
MTIPAGPARLPRHIDPRPPGPHEVVRFEGNAKRLIEIGRTRLLVTGALFALAFLAVGLRLVAVMALQNGGEPRPTAALPQHALPAERADILDRNGVVLATALATASLYANPRQVPDPAEAAARLATVLPEPSQAEIALRLSSERSFVWLKRNLTPRQQYAVNRLGIPGLYFQPEERRVYPHGPLAAHVLGFTDIDNRGLAGVEQSFDDVLRGGRHPVRLSLDVRVQYLLHEELSRAMTEFTAIGAAGIVLDAATGEVLAMASLPDFDPNRPGAAPDDARFNRATLGIYEMGSTFKIFNTAMALENGVAGLADRYDARYPIRVGGFTISDYKPKSRWLTVPEIFILSSNIGSARMALDVGADAQQAFFARIGMFRPAGIELPEVGQPMYPATWRPINTMTVAYGHGIAVSPLHLAAGVAAVVNGGIMRPATIIRRAPDEVTSGERVVSAQTSAQMRELMRLVVREGTGRKADAPGYAVGGKTGTADKARGRGYSRDSRIASFVGAFPIHAPRYVVLIMVDEPKPNESSHGYATGGWVAAPAVSRLVQRIAPLLGVPPGDEPAPEAADGLLLAAHATESAGAVE